MSIIIIWSPIVQNPDVRSLLRSWCTCSSNSILVLGLPLGKMKTMNKATEYVAALCHMRDSGLVPFDSERFIATTKAEAAAKAQKWAMSTVGVIVDKTWLHVTLDGAGVYSKELRGAVTPEALKVRSAPPE
jgi:hypothetical protein